MAWKNKKESGLRRLDTYMDGYDRASNIWRQVDRINVSSLADLQNNTTERNKFINSMRALQSNLRKHFIKENEIQKKIDNLTLDFSKAKDISEKVEIMFRKFDTLNEIIDDLATPPDYATTEEIPED
jgi:hypothetical protein